MRVAALRTRMFADRPLHIELARTCADLGIEIELDLKTIADDVIVFHNPSFLKFETGDLPRLMCDFALIVNHENLLTPQGLEGFDVGHCLGLLDEALLCRQAQMAAVSPYNRSTIENWQATQDNPWQIAPALWPNIIDLPRANPNARPQDRRGRHSRVGAEKFPSRAAMEALFPPHAFNAILGGDLFIDQDPPAYWHIHKFRSLSVDRFLSMIDFFVYFTHPALQESFGRVLAEAIAAGKMVITDPATAQTFGPGVMGCSIEQVDGIIQSHIADPKAYVECVRQAQAGLDAFAPAQFLANVRKIFDEGQAAL